MKFLLVTDGTWGDTLPFIFLAMNLKQKGHEVVLFSNEFYKEYVQSKNITFVRTTTLEQRNECLQNPLLWHPKKGMKVIGHYVGTLFEEALPQIEKHIEGKPIIIGHTFSYAAKTVAEKYNLDFVALLISPIQLRTNYRFPVFHGGKDVNKLPHYIHKILYPLVDLFIIDPHFNTLINKSRKKMGLKVIKGFAHWMTFNNLSIALWPSWYVPLEKDQNTAICAGFPKHVEIESTVHTDLMTWIKNGEKPIVITMGSGYLFGQKLFETIKEISAEHNKRFILVGLYENSIEHPLIKIYKHIQLSAVLPLSELIIHHGGAGTLAQATVSGTPQLIIPMSHDQPDNASYIVKKNLGTVLWKINPTKEELYSAIQITIASMAIKDACSMARKKIASEEDGIEVASKYLLKRYYN